MILSVLAWRHSNHCVSFLFREQHELAMEMTSHTSLYLEEQFVSLAGGVMLFLHIFMGGAREQGRVEDDAGVVT